MKNEKLYIKVILYSLSLILICYYFYVFYNSLNPKNVCKEYRMYYITNELEDWPGYNGLDYNIGTKLMFKNNSDNISHGRGKGWNDIEDQGTWTTDQAYLYININDDINEELILNIGIEQFAPESIVSINVNDTDVTTFIPEKDIKNYRIPIPENIIQNKLLKIRFNVENASRSIDIGKNNDQRLLGICITDITLDKKGDEYNE